MKQKFQVYEKLIPGYSPRKNNTGLIIAKGMYEIIALGIVLYAIFTFSLQWFLAATVMRLLQYIFNHK